MRTVSRSSNVTAKKGRLSESCSYFNELKMTNKLTESYLGPVLFNALVNDIGSILEAYLLLLRVDDSKIFF